MMNGMMDHDLDDVFQRHELPEEVKDMMRSMRGHGKEKTKKNKKSKRHGKHYYEEPVEDDEDELEEGEWDGRKEAFRMFAPGLWEKANRHSRHGRHGPMVMADKKKDAVADWPKMQKMCPVMLFFIFASIYVICHIKFLEKALAKLELLQKAKKLVKMTGKKEKPAQVPVQVPVQPVQVVVPQPVAPKKCKKQIKKEQKAAQMAQQVVMPKQFVVAPQPQVVMPVIQKFMKKIDDVEAIPRVNESFDYSMTDPLVDGDDEIQFEPQSATGVTSSKNSMI